MHVIVTGGAGFIGSNLVDHLIAHGCEVTVIDDLSGGNRTFVHPKAHLHVLDITSTDAAHLVQAIQPDAVVHLAAQIEVSKSIMDPTNDAQVNVVGTLNILHAAQSVATACFVSISSGGALYGQAEQLPTPESAPITPMSPYGASKYCSEVYLELISRSSSMRCISLRLSNVYGPRQSLFGEAGVVAIFAKRILKDQTLTIFGDGLQTRDFVYVKDVCEAIYASLTRHSAKGSFNVGTGLQTTIENLIEKLRQAADAQPTINFSPPLPGEVRYSALDASKAAQNLNWRPQVYLEAGLAKTVAFFQESDVVSTNKFSSLSQETAL